MVRMNKMIAIAAVGAIFLMPALAAEPQSDLPIKGWLVTGSSPQQYIFGTEHVDGTAGKAAYIKARTPSPSGFGSLGQLISADNYRGQRLRLSAQIKTSNAARAQLWMRVDGPDTRLLGFYNMGDKPVVGTTDWKRYDVVLDVPAEAMNIAFGYFLSGDGIVWATDFKLEPVGKDVAVSKFPNEKKYLGGPENMNFDQ